MSLKTIGLLLFLLFDFWCYKITIVPGPGTKAFSLEEPCPTIHKNPNCDELFTCPTISKIPGTLSLGLSEGLWRNDVTIFLELGTNVTISSHCHIIFLGSAWNKREFQNLARSWVLGSRFYQFRLGTTLMYAMKVGSTTLTNLRRHRGLDFHFIFNSRVDIYTPSSTVKDRDYRVVESRILKSGRRYQPKLIINIISQR